MAGCGIACGSPEEIAGTNLLLVDQIVVAQRLRRSIAGHLTPDVAEPGQDSCLICITDLAQLIFAVWQALSSSSARSDYECVVTYTSM